MSRSLTQTERDLSDKGIEAFNALSAITGAYVPRDLLPFVRDLLWTIESLGFEHSFEGERMLYARLLELLPDHVQEIRRAYQETILDGCEEDWEGYAVTPPPPFLRLL